MQMQHPNEIYQDEYGNEVMINPVGQMPMGYQTNDPTNALVSHNHHSLVLFNLSRNGLFNSLL